MQTLTHLICGICTHVSESEIECLCGARFAHTPFAIVTHEIDGLRIGQRVEFAGKWDADVRRGIEESTRNPLAPDGQARAKIGRET
jgi:hypothetical protein